MEHFRISVRPLRAFATHEDGAVTVDYVVILGSIIGLGLAVTGSVATRTISYSENTSEFVSNVDVGSASASDVGNPGNDKDVGKAGETPDGGDDWGSGSKGKSS